eukprot:scaffold2518_cov178-Amphora_coffeaeformis.AAC.22
MQLESTNNKRYDTNHPVFVITIALVACSHIFCCACLVRHLKHLLLEQIECQIIFPGHNYPAPMDKKQLDWFFKQSGTVDCFRWLEEVERRDKISYTRCRMRIYPPQPTSSSDLDKAAMEDDECASCGHRFCWVHGDMHPGISCTAFFERTERGQQLLQKERALAARSTPCSQCLFVDTVVRTCANGGAHTKT